MRQSSPIEQQVSRSSLSASLESYSTPQCRRRRMDEGRHGLRMLNTGITRWRLSAVSVNGSGTATVTSYAVENASMIGCNFHFCVDCFYQHINGRSTQGDRSFSVAAPRAWNSLPSAVRAASSLTTFRRELKTLFSFYSSFLDH